MATNEPFDAGAIDVEALSRLANQFFQAVPGVLPAQSGGVSALAPDAAGQPPELPPNAVWVAEQPALRPPPVPVPAASTGGPVDLPTAPAPLSPTASAPAPSSLPYMGISLYGADLDIPALVLGGLPLLTGDLPSSPQIALAAVGQLGSSYHFLDHIAVSPGTPAAAPAPAVSAPFDINQIKRDFPILEERVNGRQLVWLDNAATTQKPRQVIDRISQFYQRENSNIHRAAHELAARATDAYEGAREKVRGFLNAASANEIVFVRGATEAINLVAQSWGRQHLTAGDEIIVSWLEHHANIVPWQRLCAETGARLRVIPVDDTGQIQLDEYAKLLGPRTKLVSVTQVSNALGTVTPVKTIIDMAHHAGAKALVDGAQAVSHMPVDVRALNADWYVFSGHKVFGPTGIGALYGKEALLNETQPWQGGGNMIKDVTFEHTQYHDAPARFEAGTGNIADAVGLGAAIDYVSRLGMAVIEAYEHQLLVYGTKLLSDIPGLRLVGTAREKAGVLSFVLDGFRTEEVGSALNREGIAVRSGHHCAQPILRRFGLEATVRPSLAFYNTCGDLDALAAAITRIKSRQAAI